ncbi:MAG: cell division FtsA domain-containing protein [Lachnospiraceae bacterium]|nr:cell division FtsA domain-containing protein [Lachnospiraceae bacterium]
MGELKLPEHLVFGLDIGTRSIVGSVGYMDGKKFNVAGHYVKEHETRAMMDGQIHDIAKVGETIDFVKRELENQIGRPLNDVCIAAAGRVLKTVTIHVDMDRADDMAVTDEDIYSLDMLGVEKAYDIMRADYPDVEFYCVGYTVVKYYMNGYIIGNLEGHKGKNIGADILATFLPNEVIEDLYSATSIAKLNVANLTLEPIAAINIAIPENFRLLNIALVDVGAGTSDISITKDGSIIAYGMIPHAGDEITEAILNRCLCDFKTAETIKLNSMKKSTKSISYKDVMGLKQKLTPAEVRDMYADTVENMTREIAEKIKELNGGKSVNAVFVVGGGGKAFGFTESLANHLGIPKERVALRGEEVLGDVNFLVEGVKKDPLLVTPIGICMNFYNQKNHFIYVNINDERIKLYDNDHLTVVDAAMQIGFPNEALFPKRGKSLSFNLNNKLKMIKGDLGEAAYITVNGHEANINSKIAKNDKIYIKESTAGEDAIYTVGQLAEYKESISFMINGVNVTCPKFAEVNKELVTASYSIQDGDDIHIRDYYTVLQILQFMDFDSTGKVIYVNGHKASEDEPVYGGFKVNFEDIDYLNEQPEEMVNDLNEVDIESATDEEIIVDNTEASNESASATKVDEQNQPPVATPVSSIPINITITVNGTPVTLKNKASYIFVDILDFYPFNTQKAGGSDLVRKINGVRCDFTSPLNQGDAAELYWTS